MIDLRAWGSFVSFCIIQDGGRTSLGASLPKKDAVSIWRYVEDSGGRVWQTGYCMILPFLT